MITLNKQIFPLTILVLAASLTCCSHTAGKKPQNSVSDIERSDSVPASVKMLVRDIYDNNAEAFAAHVNYPLERPYPLHDIADSAAMTRYYSTLVDDSLRNVILTAGPGRWGEYGWRGWTLDDGQYVWLDSLVYDIPYVSKDERELLSRMRQLDMTSLAPSLRGDWTPVIAYSCGNDCVIRIDARRGADRSKAGSLRMMMFNHDTPLDGMPVHNLSGQTDLEGSRLTTTYDFRDADGTQYIFDVQPADGDMPTLTVTAPDGSESSLQLTPVYWLDLPPVRK